MSSLKQRPSPGESAARSDSLKPNNPLQSDFNANDDATSMDSDERYLVRASGS